MPSAQIQVIRFSFFCALIASGLTASVTTAHAAEADAVALSRHVRQYQMPYGQIAMTMNVEPSSDSELIRYEDVGDTALWSGLYLAAEAFRNSVTHDAESLDAVRNALNGIQLLVDAPGTGYLARSTWPVDGEKVEPYLEIEGRYGMGRSWIGGREYYWQAGVTRDQYAGVFFGLGAAYDRVEDPAVRAQARELITRLVDYLLKKHWTPRAKTGTRYFSTTFLHRPEMQLSILQLAKHVNPGRFKKSYERARLTKAPLASLIPSREADAPYTSYFKFNLGYLYYFNLITFERNEDRRRAYVKHYLKMHSKIAHHLNAHFNMIDRAIRGPDDARDRSTRGMLEQLLAIGFRHRSVDLRGKYPSCGVDRACDPIPVIDRAIDGFIWQRGPFTLYYEGDPRFEGNGVDYMLPYWMARAYGVLTD